MWPTNWATGAWQLGNNLAQQKYVFWCCGFCCGAVKVNGNACRNICKDGPNFLIATMVTKMATQWSKSNYSMAIPSYTELMNFRKIGPVVSLKPVYKPKTCSQEFKNCHHGNKNEKNIYWLKSNQSVMVPNNTLLMNFIQICPLVCLKTCLWA